MCCFRFRFVGTLVLPANQGVDSLLINCLADFGSCNAAKPGQTRPRNGPPKGVNGVAAYGWSALDWGHGFHATKQGERHTLSEPARRTVLDRLLALNHQRYAEELAAGLHEKKSKKKAAAKAAKPNTSPGVHATQLDLLPPAQAELF